MTPIKFKTVENATMEFMRNNAHELGLFYCRNDADLKSVNPVLYSAIKRALHAERAYMVELLTRTACAYCRARIPVHKPRGEHGGYWHPLPIAGKDEKMNVKCLVSKAWAMFPPAGAASKFIGIDMASGTDYPAYRCQIHGFSNDPCPCFVEANNKKTGT